MELFLHTLRFLELIFTYHTDHMCVPFTLCLYGGITVGRKRLEKFHTALKWCLFPHLALNSGPILHH